MSTSRSGWRALLVLQRVDVGHQVAAHAVGVDDLLHAGGLVQIVSWDAEMSCAQRIGS